MNAEGFTSFDEVYAKFLSKVNDYELVTHADDFEFILSNFLTGAVSMYYTGQLEPRLEGISMKDRHFGTQLTMMEQWMIATAMVDQWLDTKIYKEDLMRTAISDRDYAETSPANQLKALREIKTELEYQLHHYDVNYSYIGFTGLD